MQNIRDKKVYNTIEEILDPSHTALVVGDVQNILANRIFNKEEFAKNIKSIMDISRKLNISIFFTKSKRLPFQFESSARIYTFSKLGFDRMEQPTNEEMSFTILPDQNEMIVDKHTASIFIDTMFEQMLRNAGIITIIFIGIATEFGIESCSRDALNRCFYPIVISDGVSSSDKIGHERSLENM